MGTARAASLSCPGVGRATVQRGDWLALARELAPGSVDFLYADPPFNTGVVKRTPPGAHRRGARAGLAARGAEGGGGGARSAMFEGRTRGALSYADSWATMGAYVSWLGARLEATLPAMRRTGVVAVHCDFRACHHIRLLLDELLTPGNFVNHLIWSYGLGGSSPRRFARKHDDILVYAMDPRRYYFEAPMVPATSQRLRGKMKKATDVLEIASLNNMAGERTGYPTQKPRALLEVLVRAFCPAGGLVLDPCCGSGTTLAAAAALGREAVGWDVSAGAVGVARRRVAGGS